MNRNRDMVFSVIGILAIFIIAMGLSLTASSFPDGLEKVAENLGFIDKTSETLPEGFFLIPDYAFTGVKDERLQISLAGFFGVLIIFALFVLVYLIYRAADSKDTKNKKK